MRSLVRSPQTKNRMLTMIILFLETIMRRTSRTLDFLGGPGGYISGSIAICARERAYVLGDERTNRGKCGGDVPEMCPENPVED